MEEWLQPWSDRGMACRVEGCNVMPWDVKPSCRLSAVVAKAERNE